MDAKHTPATPLPWRVGAVTAARFPAYPIVGDAIVANVTIRASGGSDKDAAYIAKAANAYPKLVEKSRALYDSLQGRLNTLIHHTATPHEKAAYRKAREEFRALLRELGEDA